MFLTLTNFIYINITSNRANKIYIIVNKDTASRMDAVSSPWVITKYLCKFIVPFSPINDKAIEKILTTTVKALW